MAFSPDGQVLASWTRTPSDVFPSSFWEVAILERANTTAARQHLAVLAAGALGARLTEEAQSALAQLRQRENAKT